MKEPCLPGWEIIELIGEGSFGKVYKIQRDVLGTVEQAALKVITIPQNKSEIANLISEGYDTASINEHYKEYLMNIVHEYSVMSELRGNSNIVDCNDLYYVEHEDGVGWDIYIRMELLTPMTDKINTNNAVEQTIQLGIDMCNALILCKKHNIVHRDIKPQNIFISKYGQYKLGDFGIAKVAERTTTGTKTGTFRYMAPEVYNNQPYGGAVDIYSLGLVMYWMLNQRRTPFLPLPPEIPTVSIEEEARKRRMNGDKIPKPINGTEDLKKIVCKACEFDVNKRYQSPEEMLQDLKKLQNLDETIVITQRPTPKKKNNFVIGLGIAVIVGVLVIWIATRPEETTTGPAPIVSEENMQEDTTDSLQDNSITEDTELTGPTVTLSYVYQSEDVSVEEWLDIQTIVKEQFDALEQPYSFKAQVNEQEIVITTGIEHMGMPIMNLLGTPILDITVRNGLIEEYLYSDTINISSIDNEDGTYSVLLDVGSYEKESIEKLTQKMIEEGNNELIFLLEDVPFFKTTVDSVITDGKIVFSDIYYGNIGKITEDNLWLAKWIETMWTKRDLSRHLTLKSYEINTDGAEEDSVQYGISNIQEDAKTIEKLQQIIPEAKIVIDDSNQIKVNLNLDVDETLPQQAISLVKELYLASELESSSYKGISFYLIEEDIVQQERARIFFEKRFGTIEKEGYIKAHGIFVNGRIEKYKDEFVRILEEDPFFDEYTNEGEESWTTDWKSFF